MRARYYDPTTGQFVSSDPLEAETQQPYSYANDDPVNEVDPTGLWGWNPISDVEEAGSDAATFVEHHARPIIEAGVTVAACGVPGFDVVTCPEAIIGIAAVNVGINTFNTYEYGCSAGSALDSDAAEASVAALGLISDGTISLAEKGVEDLPEGLPGLAGAKNAVRYVNGLATGTGIAAGAAIPTTNGAGCGCQG